MCEIAYEVFAEFTSLNPQLELKRHFHGFDYFEILGIDVGIVREDKEGSISQFKAWYLDESLDKQKPIPTRGLLLDALNDASNSQAKLDVINLLPSIMLNDAIEQQGHALSNPFEAHNDFISNLRIEIAQKFINWDTFIPTAEYANALGIKYGVAFNFDDGTFADSSFSNSSSGALLDLYLYILIESFDNTVSEPIDDCFAGDEVFEGLFGKELLVKDCIKDVAGIGKTIFSTIKESLLTPVFWFEPSNERHISHVFGLSLNLAVDISTNSSIVEFRELLSEIQQVFQSELFNPHQAALIYALTDSKLFGNFGISDFDGFKSSWPYLNLGVIYGIGELHEFPLKLVNIAKSIDFDFVAQKTLTNLLKGKVSEASFSTDGYSGEGVLEIRDIGLVNNYMEKISSFLHRLDIGVKHCKFEYSENLAEWVSGHASKFVFVTDSTIYGEREFGIPFSRLSSAQQYWVQAAFWLMSVESSEKVCVVTADEPERGLHERAIIQVLSELSKTKSTSVVSSHSSRALRLPDARLLHLERVKSGELILGSPWLGEDIASAAARLGTTTFDLFALKRALVIVEGSHDVEVVKGLASLHIDGTLLDQILIVPARGVKNVATVADSVVITEFTSLHILAITDNGRAELLKNIISKANEALSSGATAVQAITISGLRDIGNNATFEERVMQDLIERAIHRGMLHRLHIYALPVEDIVDLLPEKAFGLETTWKELRDEHRSFPVRMSFKDWLREEKKVSVSVRSIKRAFDSIDNLNEPLSRILHELEIVTSLSPLEGNF
jgi:hypothetical protein